MRAGSGGIEQPLEAVEVADAPRSVLAVRAVGAALDVVPASGDVPVADVDHVQRAVVGERTTDGRVQEDSERTVRDRGGAACREAVPAGVKVEVDVAEQHLRHDRVGQLQPAVAVQEQVVLEALRDQNEAWIVATVDDGIHGRLSSWLNPSLLPS